MLQAEGAPQRPDRSLVLNVQNAALQILQIIISHGQTSGADLGAVKSALVRKLDWAIRRQSWTLQRKMLHLLQECMRATAAASPSGHRRSQSSISLLEKSNPKGFVSAANPDTEFDAALERLVIDGLSCPAIRPVIQHWVDFVLQAAPLMKGRRGFLEALCECISKQLRLNMLHLRDVFSQTTHNLVTRLTDAEPLAYLDALEGTVKLLMTSGLARRSEEGAPRPNEGGSGILGLMSGVFIAEAPVASEGVSDAPMFMLIDKAKPDGRSLDYAVNALLLTWSVTTTSPSAGPTAPSKAHIFSRIRDRAREVLERLFKAQPPAVVGSCVHVWSAAPEDILVRPTCLGATLLI